MLMEFVSGGKLALTGEGSEDHIQGSADGETDVMFHQSVDSSCGDHLSSMTGLRQLKWPNKKIPPGWGGWICGKGKMVTEGAIVTQSLVGI